MRNLGAEVHATVAAQASLDQELAVTTKPAGIVKPPRVLTGEATGGWRSFRSAAWHGRPPFQPRRCSASASRELMRHEGDE